MPYVTFTEINPSRVAMLSRFDIKENALVYLHQVNELQKAKWHARSFFGWFDEGSTYGRNRSPSGEDHFTRLIHAIEPIVCEADTAAVDGEDKIQNLVSIYNQAFSGFLMWNAMGSRVGSVSSYHIILRKWFPSLTSGNTREILSHQWKIYQAYKDSLIGSH